ncbi:MAG: hypothetical protein KJ718_04435 [Nanoarchaeota archaeon]|nr:hypothetical protein [Nanoarchaeota archaeon]MBU1051777.1 hypothetical protein [Nanoarchaeota archaeon]
MEKIDGFAVASGTILMIVGLVLIVVAFFSVKFLLIYGFVLLLIGIVILATLKQQEFVEPIKQKAKK